MPNVESTPNPTDEDEVNNKPNTFLPLMMFHPIYKFSDNFETGFPLDEQAIPEQSATADHSTKPFFNDDPYQEASVESSMPYRAPERLEHHR